MNHQSNLFKQKLDHIAVNNDWAGLAAFEDPQTWQSFEEEDKEALAFLFASHGAQLLVDHLLDTADGCFERAMKLSPHNPQLHFKIALTYAMFPENQYCLQKSSQIFSIATVLSPTSFEAWCVWGNVNTSLAKLTQQFDYCQLADSKYQEAEKLIAKDADPLVVAEFNWRWGGCWAVMGVLSGEACDLKIAYEKYKIAESLKIQAPDFFVAFGTLLYSYAQLLRQDQLLVEALEKFHIATELDQKNAIAWLHIGIVSFVLFELNGQMEVFRFALQGFETAAQLQPDDFELWVKWGQLLLLGGKILRDLDLVEASEEKFAHAYAFESDSVRVLSYWAEAQVIIGCHTEKLSLLKSAEDKLHRCLEMAPQTPYAWGVLGCCYNEMGRYFNDASYFNKGIEMFQRGISLEHSDPKLWYGLATSYFALGDLNADPIGIEKSLHYFSQVTEFGLINTPNFWNDWGVAMMRLAELCESKPHLEGAIEKFEQAIILSVELSEDEDINDAEILYNYGCALDFLGDFTDDAQHYEKAIQVLTRVIMSSDGYVNAYYNLALAYSHLGELVADVDILYKANEHFEVYLHNDPEDEAAWNDWGVNHLQIAHLVNDPAIKEHSGKHFNLAETKLLQSAALGNRYCYYNLGCLYSLTHNFPASFHYLEKAAHTKTLPPIEEILHDDWLNEIRKTQDFEQFLAQLKID